MGKGYVGLGAGRSNSESKSDFWRYNPIEDSWEQIAAFPVAIFSASAFVIADTAYVCGGIIGINENEAIQPNNVYDKCYAYDVSNNRWIDKGKTTRPVAGAASFTDGEYGYLIGGLSSTLSATDYSSKYSPKTGTWTEIVSLPNH